MYTYEQSVKLSNDADYLFDEINSLPIIPIKQHQLQVIILNVKQIDVTKYENEEKLLLPSSVWCRD